MRLEKVVLYKLIGLFLFATAMGYSESTVVVYLRELYYQGGFHIISEYSLRAVPFRILLTEAGRELSTLVILVSLSILLVRKNWLERFGYFLFAFSIWDITYYVWLYFLIRWPASLLSNDVLFLIPRPWIGPVLAPILISCCFIFLSMVILSSKKEINSFKEFKKMWKYWVYITTALWVIISGFILFEYRIFYMWNNIIIGLFIGTFTVLLALRKKTG
jgi:hypothetical protein